MLNDQWMNDQGRLFIYWTDQPYKLIIALKKGKLKKWGGDINIADIWGMERNRNQRRPRHKYANVGQLFLKKAVGAAQDRELRRHITWMVTLAADSVFLERYTNRPRLKIPSSS